MKTLILTGLFILALCGSASANFMDFTNYTWYNFAPMITTSATPSAVTYYLLIADSSGALTTPTGDKITIVH